MIKIILIGVLGILVLLSVYMYSDKVETPIRNEVKTVLTKKSTIKEVAVQTEVKISNIKKPENNLDISENSSITNDTNDTINGIVKENSISEENNEINQVTLDRESNRLKEEILYNMSNYMEYSDAHIITKEESQELLESNLRLHHIN